MVTPMLMQSINKTLWMTSFFLFACSNVLAQDFKFEIAPSVDIYVVDSSYLTSTDIVSISDTVVKNTVSVNAEYESKRLALTSKANYAHVKHQDSEQAKNENTFLDYNISSEFDLYESYLKLNASHALSQRAVDSSFGALSDQIVGSENLSDVKNTRLALSFSNANKSALSADATLYLTRSKVDSGPEGTDIFSVDRYNTKTSGLNINLKSQDKSEAISWFAQLGSSESNRGGLLSEYKRENFNAGLSFLLKHNISLETSALINRNQIDQSQTSGNELIDLRQFNYRQVGVGAGYHFKKGSYAKLLAYTSKTNEAEALHFLGGEFLWLLSNRTKIELTADRNQFGEVYGLQWVQSNRYLQMSAKYSEGIDIISRTQVQLNDDLNDEVVQVEQGSLNLAYNNLRKLSMSVNITSNKIQSLEDIRVATNNRKTNRVSTQFTYQWTRLTALSLLLSRSHIEYLTTATLAQLNGRKDQNTAIMLSLTSQFSEGLSARLALSQQQRKLSVSSFNLDDKRINLNATYRF